MTVLKTSRALWWGLPVLLVLLWTTDVLVAPNIPGLPQAPEITWIALPVTRFVRDLAAAFAVGGIIVGGLLSPRPIGRALQWASGWAFIWLAAAVLQIVFTLSDLVAVDPGSVLSVSALWSFLTQVQVGQVFLAQCIGALLVGLTAWAVVNRTMAWVVAVIAVAAAAAPGLNGHGGLSGGHESASISLSLHIASVAVWVGGLAVVIALLKLEPNRASTLLPRFSTLALVCVIVVAETGLLNASLRITSAGAFLSSPYGALLVAKAILLAALVLLGWQQRSRVIPAIRDGEPVTTSLLARVAGWEFVAMGIAVAVSVTMSRVGPAPETMQTHLVTPLMLVLLGLGVPMVIRAALPGDPRVPRWLANYPEIPAVLLLIAVIEVAGVGVTESMLGTNLGAVVGGALIVLLGWLYIASLRPGRATSALVLVMVGWPIAAIVITFFESRQLNTPAIAPIVLSVLLAEALLAMALMRLRRSAPDLVEVGA